MYQFMSLNKNDTEEPSETLIKLPKKADVKDNSAPQTSRFGLHIPYEDHFPHWHGSVWSSSLYLFPFICKLLLKNKNPRLSLGS